MSIISTNKGLTLLELLIAVALSSLVLFGLYSAISTALNTDQVIHQSLSGISEYTKLTELFQRDIRTMVSEPVLKHSYEGSEITFTTTHSLIYNSTRPVYVTYYIEEIDRKKYLLRKEWIDNEQSPLIIRLLEDIDSLSFYTKSDEGWIEKILPGKPIKMSYGFKDRTWEIIAGRIL